MKVSGLFAAATAVFASAAPAASSLDELSCTQMTQHCTGYLENIMGPDQSALADFKTTMDLNGNNLQDPPSLVACNYRRDIGFWGNRPGQEDCTPKAASTSHFSNSPQL